MTNFGVVIVTYNRLQLLKECLQCVLNQIILPTSVVIINNHSTDGTTEYLKEFCTSPMWIVINEKENLGGSGGYYEGIKAIRNDSRADWILLIDDDAMLSNNYLSDIAKAIRRFPDVGVFSGSVMTDDEIVLIHRRRLRRGKDISVPLEAYKHAYFSYNVCSFCGIVIRRDLIQKAGLPEKDFFIWYDDTEYCMRLNKYTKFINVCSCSINHKTKLDRTEHPGREKKDWKVYYGMRNTIYSMRKHGMNGAAVCHAIRFIGKPAVYRFNFFLPQEQREIYNYNFHLFADAIRDGYKGKLGINKKYLPD